MNSTKLYSDEDLKYIKKQKLYCILFLVLVLCSFAACVTLLFIFSTYDTKTYYIIGGVLISIVGCILTVYFSFKLADLNHIKRHFISINFQQENRVQITVISTTAKPITIDRFTKAYQIEVKINDETKYVYLNAMYTYAFKVEHNYEVILASDYIKEICNEL